MTALVVIVVLIVLALLPAVLERRRKPMNAALRRNAPGEFATLSQGVTHYRWIGPVRGPVIVAIHGLTTPSPVFDDLAGYLGGLGYRTLVYDLYGRGYSDAVAGPQNDTFFLRQLDDLLADQKLTEDVTLMGYSMGGAIAAAFAGAQPHRVARVILLASAGMTINESQFWRTCRRLPVLGDWIAGVFGAGQIAADAASGTSIGAIQLAELNRRGYVPAILSSRRHMLAASQEKALRVLGHEDVPVQAIWGGQDKVIPLTSLGLLAQWDRNAEQEVLADADHSLPWRHAEAVALFLKDHR